MYFPYLPKTNRSAHNSEPMAHLKELITTLECVIALIIVFVVILVFAVLVILVVLVENSLEFNVKSIICEKKRTAHDAGNLVPATSLIVAALTHVNLSS